MNMLSKLGIRHKVLQKEKTAKTAVLKHLSISDHAMEDPNNLEDVCNFVEDCKLVVLENDSCYSVGDRRWRTKHIVFVCINEEQEYLVVKLWRPYELLFKILSRRNTKLSRELIKCYMITFMTSAAFGILCASSMTYSHRPLISKLFHPSYEENT